ncbi:MAG: LPS export ABC transporter permease LptF [Bdellovibrionales bacterium]|nr:LPS export ABC transporter permease LptF [Bdellovibrionales bacterium]
MKLNFLRSKLAQKYIFFEMLPSFLMGAFLFLFIILMFQSFRLTEYVIVHGASMEMIAKIMGYLAVSFLPVILPMSLLFSVLLTYGRLSSDSEIVALKALGLNIYHLTSPAIILGVLVAILSAQTSYYLAPWGNRKMEVLIHKLGQTKPGASIKEGVFSEGFFDMVVYANKVDSKNNILKKIFIYDERNVSSPLTIIAEEGKIFQESTLVGQKAFLRLYTGNIHRTQNDLYTKVDFGTFDINLYDPVTQTEKRKTPLSYTLPEIKEAFKEKEKLKPKFLKMLEIEYHRRTALAITCIVFAILGVGLGTTTNKRSGKSSGFVLSIAVVVGFWIIYATMESLAKSEKLPVFLAVWLANFVFLFFGVWKVFKARN